MNDNTQNVAQLTFAAAHDIAGGAIVREVRVPTEPMSAWKLWSSSEGLAAWWIDGAKVDMRPGGLFEIYFVKDAPTGAQGSEGCRVLSFLPGRMLSFTWNAPPHLDHTRSRHTWVVLLFEPDGDGTRVGIHHLGWPVSEWDTEPQWPETYAYFERAWTMVAELFEKHCSG